MAKAYSANFTVAPSGPLGYLTAWPTSGRPVPEVSILKSFDGSVVANAAVVPAGTNGAIDVFVNTTEVIIDINGYTSIVPPRRTGSRLLRRTWRLHEQRGGLPCWHEGHRLRLRRHSRQQRTHRNHPQSD
jgi:hypothetical protein